MSIVIINWIIYGIFSIGVCLLLGSNLTIQYKRHPHNICEYVDSIWPIGLYMIIQIFIVAGLKLSDDLVVFVLLISIVLILLGSAWTHYFQKSSDTS